MKWIGLTGGIASGKSTAAKLIRDLGLPVIDADQLAREAVQAGSEGLKKVVSQFGTEVLNATGSLDRKALGEIVFKDKAKLETLEDILHPIIEARRADEKRRLEQENVEMAFYDVPLLFEAGLENEFDKIVLIYASKENQSLRLKERDELTLEQIEQRLNNQIPMEEKKKLSDFVIINNGSIAELKNQIAQVVSELGFSK